MFLEKNSTESPKGHSFWYYLYISHLYSSKGEALFKASIISLSWVGGFWSEASVTAYYLFSIAVIMEYAVRLITSDKFAPKILPFILILSNLSVAFASSGQLFNGSAETFSFQYIVEVVTMIIVWLDAVLVLLIEKPNECKIEETLC